MTSFVGAPFWKKAVAELAEIRRLAAYKFERWVLKLAARKTEHWTWGSLHALAGRAKNKGQTWYVLRTVILRTYQLMPNKGKEKKRKEKKRSRGPCRFPFHSTRHPAEARRASHWPSAAHCGPRQMTVRSSWCNRRGPGTHCP